MGRNAKETIRSGGSQIDNAVYIAAGRTMVVVASVMTLKHPYNSRWSLLFPQQVLSIPHRDIIRTTAHHRGAIQHISMIIRLIAAPSGQVSRSNNK